MRKFCGCSGFSTSALASPLQCNRACHGMLHFCAGAFGFQVCGFQLEIPFGGAVGVVDQHQVGIVLQAFGLEFHRTAVLLNEFGEDELEHIRHERNPSK
jgi:hypothetical protein